MSAKNTISNNNIDIRVIKPQERQKVLDFLRIYYYREEPLTAGQQEKESEEFIVSTIEHGTCVMAVKTDLKNSEEIIVGALMARPKGPHDAGHLFEKAALLGPTKRGHVLQFLAGIERDANVFERFQVQKVLHIHALGVDTKMRGQNISVLLIKEVFKLAKQLKFQLLTAYCTSFYSARVFDQMGFFELINTKYYTEYLDEKKVQVFKPEDPHVCTKTYAVKM